MDFSCTSMTCNGDHYPIKIALNNKHKYSTFNFQKLIFCYIKERLFICKYCKICQDCTALEKAFLFAEEIQKRNITEGIVVSEVLVTFNAENERIQCEIVSTTKCNDWVKKKTIRFSLV